MNLNKIKKYLIISLVLFEVCVIHLAYKSFSNKPVKLPEVKLKEIEKEKKNTYAVMIDDGNGGYTESTEDKFPTEGYKLNTEKSGCIDNDGNTIENVLSVVDNKVLVSTGSTTYCYLYFDIKPPTAGDIVTNPPAETTDGGGAVTGVAQDELEMRYYGKNPANYICFGTNDKDTCVNDTDKYMYRIIGVTKDKGKGRMFKLIKKEALDTPYYWHNSHTSDIKWNQSDLYKGLNGISGGKYSNLFIGNTTYMPSGWSNKIEDVSWKYGDFTNQNQAPATILQTEQAWNTTVTAKIGLMYVADYYYGVTKTGLNCYDSANRTTCRNNNWMHFLNNDSSAPNKSYEWTMSRYGYSSSTCRAWFVISDGYVSNPTLNATYSVRPVFYLKSNIEITGTGTQSDPYMIIT